MKTYLKWVAIIGMVFGSMALTVVAQDDGAGVDTFAGRPTLWVAIIAGFIATGVTAAYGIQLRGGVVGTALMLISGGMFLVALGFLAVVVAWAEASTQALVHDIAFIIGYILMLVGALRLRQMIR